MGKVGKRLPDGSVYVHKDAIENGNANLTSLEELLYDDASWELGHYRGVEPYDLVQINSKDRKVRFMKMSNLWDPHPHVIKSMSVDLNRGITVEGKPSGQIYHRLDTMIDPGHPSYKFHQAVTEWEVSEGLLGKNAPKSIGYQSYWERWIKEHMSLKDYMTHIGDLRESSG